MAKTIHIPAPEPVMVEEIYDDLSDEELEQASVGSLFSIQGPQFEDVSWSINRYRTRQELAMDPTGQKWDWVLDTVGELKGSDLLPQIGGGTFKIFGYRINQSGGVKLAYNRTVSLAGPRKNFAYEPPPAPAASHNGPSPELVQLLTQQQRQLDKLEMRLAMPAAAPVDPTAQMAATLGLVKAIFDMAPRPTPGPEPTPVKDVLEMLKEGMALRDSASTVGVERTPTEIIMEKAFPAVERLATAILTRRQAPPPPRPAPVETRAEVVTDPPPAAQPPPPAAATVEPDTADAEARARWSSLVQSLARAITEQREPADFAATAEDILAPDEISILKLGSADDLVAELSSAAGGRYPVLATEQAKTYVAAVLLELNSAD